MPKLETELYNLNVPALLPYPTLPLQSCLQGQIAWPVGLPAQFGLTSFCPPLWYEQALFSRSEDFLYHLGLPGFSRPQDQQSQIQRKHSSPGKASGLRDL